MYDDELRFDPNETPVNASHEGTQVSKSKGHVEFKGNKEVFQLNGDYYVADTTAWLDLYTKCRTGARFIGTQAWYNANKHMLRC